MKGGTRCFDERNGRKTDKYARGKADPYDVASDEAGFQQCASAIENDELTIMQKHVLKFVLLESLHRDLYQKYIEEEFQIRKSTVTGILKLMEKHGYIYRESVKKDARLKRIVPTAKAEEMRPKILEHIQKTEARLIEGIAPEDVLICKKALGQMLCNLSEMNKEENQKDE